MPFRSQSFVRFGEASMLEQFSRRGYRSGAHGPIISKIIQNDSLEGIAFLRETVQPTLLDSAHFLSYVVEAVAGVSHRGSPHRLPPLLVSGHIQVPEDILGASSLIRSSNRVECGRLPLPLSHHPPPLHPLLVRLVRVRSSELRRIVGVVLRRPDHSARRNERHLEITAVTKFGDPPGVPHQR